jgi:glucose-1-phosphate thymidylyltransferase
VNALILAGGYATRLFPLTETIAKPLLPLADRPMIEYILDAVDGVGEVRSLHVVTNHRFAGDFEAWSNERDRGPLEVHDDRTTSNDDRLGAIGDIQFVVERAGLENDDLLVVAGDNLFSYDLGRMVDFWRGNGEMSAVALRDVREPALARRYGVVELDAEDRILAFVEKPENPPSTLAATATYLFGRDHVGLFRTYLDEGNPPDPPGAFVQWLHAREPVYGYRFEGDWLDIGDHAQLLEADNLMRERRGLPPRGAYELRI